MKISDLYPSKFIKADDIGNQRLQLQIMSLTVEEIADNERKPVLRFLRHEKGMILNKTNATALAGAFGDDSVMWQGRDVELMAMPTLFQGKQVMGLVLLPMAGQPVPGGLAQEAAAQQQWQPPTQAPYNQQQQFQQPGPHDAPAGTVTQPPHDIQGRTFASSEAGPAIQKGQAQQQMEDTAADIEKAEQAIKGQLDPEEPIPF